MAKERWFTGFEDGAGSDTQVTAGTIISDAKWPARTGDFYCSLYTPGGTFVYQTRRPLVNSYDCPNDGDQVIARMQFAFRVRMFPTSNATSIGGFWIGSSVTPNQACGIQLNTNGTLILTSSQVGTTNGNFALSLNKWYVFRLHFQYGKNAAGPDPYQTILQVYDGAAMDGTPAPAPLETIQFIGTSNITGWVLNGIPCLGSNLSRSAILDYDDWWLSVASQADINTPDTAWPSGSRVQAVPITRQISGTWAGSYLLAADTPNSAVAGNEQTTTTIGAQTVFGHQTAVELGLIPPGQAGGSGGSGGTGATAQPFTGLPVPEGLGGNGETYCRIAQDNSLPTPIIDSITQTAGAGSYNNGVWVRAFTIEWRSTNGNQNPYCGPLTSPVFLSATAYPNFAANIQVSFAPGTPQDRFTDPANPGALNNTFYRYGIGVLVTNGYNSNGLMNPFTSQTNLSAGPANTTNLQAYGGPNAIDAGPWSPIVALMATLTPNGTLPPYANTNPSARPNTLTFLLSSPKPVTTGGGTSTTTNLFGQIFDPPSAVQDSQLPVAAAFKVTPLMQLAVGSGTVGAALINNTTYPLAINTSFGSGNQQFAIDWTPRDAAAFDALTFGAAGHTGLATTLRLGMCIGEVLTAGPCTQKNTGFGQYQQQCGIYTSNAGFQKINLPFKPTLVFVKRIGTGAATSPGCMKAWWMGGTTSWPAQANANSIAIMQLQDDGFLVGPDVSANGAAATYAYVACRDGQEDTINDCYMVSGSYQRQFSTDADSTVEMPVPTLFAASWIPDVVVFWSGQGVFTTLKTPDMVSPNSDLFNTTGLITNGIIAVGDKTFTTGNAIATGLQNVYFAYKFDSAGLLASLFQYGSFAGNNGTQVIPTNFQGEMIVVDHPAAGYQGFFRSFLGNTGANSTPWQGGLPTTGNITAIGANDFTVGASASVTGQTTYWLAWKRDGSIGNSGSSAIPPPDDTGGGTDPTNPPIGVICGGGGLPLYPGGANGNGCVQC